MAEIRKGCYGSLMDYRRLEPCLLKLEIKDYNTTKMIQERKYTEVPHRKDIITPTFQFCVSNTGSLFAGAKIVFKITVYYMKIKIPSPQDTVAALTPTFFRDTYSVAARKFSLTGLSPSCNVGKQVHGDF